VSDENFELDDTDRGIIFLLQEDARNYTADEISDKVGVSSSTVGNRINRLEDEGIIGGYGPHIDYAKAGIKLHILFICTAPPDKRNEIVEQTIQEHGVVTVRGLLTDIENIHVEVVSREFDDIVAITESLRELNLIIESSEMLNEMEYQPFDHYGADVISQSED
jgi:DNA-binding Lrp family transcriptional regulator